MEEPDETLLGCVRCPVVAVIGAARGNAEWNRLARRVGRLLAEAGVGVVTGGLGGVMESASQGAYQAGGLTIGILPGSRVSESRPNPYVQIPIFTGLGDARNSVVVRTADAVIAVGGGFGTLSEIGLALKAGRHVILLHSWDLTPPGSLPEMEELLHLARNPQDAVSTAVAWAGAAKVKDIGDEAGPEKDENRG